MKTHNIRLSLGGLTQKSFSERFGIPRRTVENWDTRGKMPVYIGNMLYEIIKLENEINDLKVALNLAKLQDSTDGLDFLD